MKLGKMLSIGEVVEDSAAEDRPAEGKAAGSRVAEGTAAAEHAAQAVSGQASRAAVTADGWDVSAVAHAER